MDEEQLESDMALLKSAMEGNHGEGQSAIAREIIRLGALVVRKHSDYGGSVWQRPMLAPDCDPGMAIRVRMSDKISRLSTLLSKSTEVADESIEDTLRDLSGYCILALARPGRNIT